MSTTKRCHFVWREYLTNWESDKTLFCSVYQVKPRPLAPKKVANQRYFYEIAPFNDFEKEILIKAIDRSLPQPIINSLIKYLDSIERYLTGFRRVLFRSIKVAGESGGERRPLTAEQERQLKAYISKIKDAGVRVALVNMEADTFGCTVDVYYNAMLEPGAVQTACLRAIRDYIENLPFNGEYTNMALVDRLQEVEGVKIVELRGSTAQAANESTTTQINARLTPAAGYFRPGAITVNMKAYDEQG